jgi:hypothetical protein
MTHAQADFKPLEGRITDFQLGYKYAHNAHMYGTTHPPYAYHDVVPKLPVRRSDLRFLSCLESKLPSSSQSEQQHPH